MTEPLEILHAGLRAIVTKIEVYPYLWIDVGEAHYFLGVLEPQMSRGDVKRMAERWLVEHRRQFAP